MPVTTDPPRITGSIYPSLQFRSLKISPAENKNVRSPRHLTITVHFRFSHSCLQLFVTPWIAAHQASLCMHFSNSCPSNRWCHSTISSSVIHFSSILQSCPASAYFLMSQFFQPGGHSIGLSASTSVLPMNIQDWFLLGRTGWVTLQSKGLSRVFSNTTVQKHQFFGTQPSS